MKKIAFGDNQVSNSVENDEESKRARLNSTVEALLKMRMPKLSLSLSIKIERSQKTYSCLYIFGDNLYVGTKSSKLYMYKINGVKLENQRFINPHCEIVSSVVANHRFFITIPECDDESEIGVWETRKDTFLTAFKGHKSQISKVIFMREENLIASASWDGTARIWSLENLENDEHYRLYKGTYPILQLQEVNKEVMAFGGDDCYLVFWNWRKEEVLHKVFGHAGSVTFIYEFYPYLLTCGGDNKFKLWEVTQTMVEQKNEPDQDNQKQLSEVGAMKLTAKLSRTDREQYDSSVFCVSLNETEVFVIDRQGESFLCSPQKTHRLTNQFEYNENVTGIARYGAYFFISTTKGCIKVFSIKRKEEDIRDQSAVI